LLNLEAVLSAAICIGSRICPIGKILSQIAVFARDNNS